MTDTLPPLVDSDVFGPDDADTVTPNTTGSEYSCEVCGAPVFYKRRGKHPHPLCDEHKATPGTRSTIRATTPGVEALKRQFQAQWSLIAWGVGTINETDGRILFVGGPGLTEALGNAAEVDPKFRKAFAKAMQATVYGQIVAAVVPMVAMIAANHGIIPATSAMVNAVQGQEPTSGDNGTADRL